MKDFNQQEVKELNDVVTQIADIVKGKDPEIFTAQVALDRISSILEKHLKEEK